MAFAANPGGYGETFAEGEALGPPLQDVEDFFQRYPCDIRAQDYLRSSPGSVVARALQEFRPPREGEPDYSALVVTFVRTLRTELLTGPVAAVQQDAATTLEADIQAFMLQFPVDEAAYNYLMNSTPEVQRTVLRDFRPKIEGESDYSALVITFTKKCRQTVPQQQAFVQPYMQQYVPHEQGLMRPARPQHYVPPARPGLPAGHPAGPRSAHEMAALQAEVQVFRERYPFDEEAYNYLVNSPPEVQRQVMREFKPKQEGEADYSALVITFSKRCRGNAAGMVAQQAYAVVQTPGPGLRGQQLALAPVAHSGGPSAVEYEAFRRRYPFDEAAHNYLMNSAPEVQLQALRSFRPPREGESDYSALFITYTKRCRQNVQQHHVAQQAGRAGCGNGAVRYAGPPPQQHYQPPVAPWEPGAPAPPWRQQPPGRQVDLESFRIRYPMDDRAYVYLQESPPEVARQVVETFVPKRLDDTDFSAPIVAYAKLCRARFAEAASFGMSAVAGGTHPAGGGVHFNAASYTGPEGGDYAMASEISAFCQRFPMDRRARDFLYESPPGVIARVLREFRPKREGDADYSAAVVYFVGICRKEAGVDPNTGGMLPVKRPRVAY
mmetsp:Transcript_7363/g.23068  ORF Transcript_7363/g.23068 Transcript_7363/m.23068 type:complete len:608 (-) Transcript_7363:66-1889(-)